MVNAYFRERGMVRQQLDSFDEFVVNTMQVILLIYHFVLARVQILSQPKVFTLAKVNRTSGDKGLLLRNIQAYVAFVISYVAGNCR